MTQTSDATAALGQVAAIGPFFTVRCGERAGASDFRPLGELHDPALLAPRVREFAERMGTPDLRVAASTMQLGLVSRLWSAALGSAVLAGWVPDLAPDRLYWRRPRDSGLELWLPAPRFLPGPAARPARSGEPPEPGRHTGGDNGPDTGRVSELSGLAHTAVVGAHLGPLHESVRRVSGLSPQVLRGNAGSGLVGAARVLLGRHPESFRLTTALVERLLASEPLAGTGEFTAEEGLGTAFRRRSCCLYYRVVGRGGLCGDCVLHDRAARR
ncbi:(2Fe-2S)-binding protein [Streptomyces sp. AJS327]|uniref:(2Fe-2S)-binding protein n=1 Tax=Streptomyces sp. AJS327 TaxID=2545265 RepID=UPI0015DE11BD|nr:(2Fe-2S)-binding protein [Streptomyces sp. AJS327]MBA0051664.1 (2Fe-2S)-binding protein [Streptomyces sp. AJS327]